MSDKRLVQLSLDALPKGAVAAQVTLTDLSTLREHTAATKLHGALMTLRDVPQSPQATYIEVALLDNMDVLLDRIVIVSRLPRPTNTFSIKSLAGLWDLGRRWSLSGEDNFDAISILPVDKYECDATHIYSLCNRKSASAAYSHRLFYKNSDSMNAFFFAPLSFGHLRLNQNFHDSGFSHVSLPFDRTFSQLLTDKRVLSTKAFDSRGGEHRIQGTLWQSRNESVIERLVVGPTEVESTFARLSLRYAGQRANITGLANIPVEAREVYFMAASKNCSNVYRGIPLDYKDCNITVIKADLSLYPLTAKRVI